VRHGQTEWNREERFRGRVDVELTESLQALRSRALASLPALASRHPDDVVVAVAHDAVNRVLLLEALAAPLD
jgi:broad specificity phosphatase PhoE